MLKPGWERQVEIIRKTAEVLEPGCAITQAEIIEYLDAESMRSPVAPQKTLDALDRGALKIIGKNAL